jgi:hypothetical protein
MLRSGLISQWHKKYRFVVGFLEEMEATVAFSPLENWGQEGFDASKPLGFNPAKYKAGRDQAFGVRQTQFMVSL